MTPWVRSLLPLSMVCACSFNEPALLLGTIDEIRLEEIEYDESVGELRLEGTFRVQVDAIEDTDATFVSLTIGTAGDAIDVVEAEVEPLDPVEPLSLRAGESEVRRFRFSSVHRVYPSPSCWDQCDGVCAPERRFRPSVFASIYAASTGNEIAVYGESSEEQVLDPEPLDLGFPSATLTLSSLSTSAPVPTACTPDACYLFQDNGTVASLARADGAQVEQLPLWLLATGSKPVGASAAGAVVTYFWGLGLELQTWLPGGQTWSRTIEPPDGVVVRVAASGDQLLVAAPLEAGLTVGGQSIVEPAEGQVALLRLDAHTAEVIAVATIPAAGVSALASRADGGVVVATPLELVLLDAELVETQRWPYGLTRPVLHDAPGGELVVVEPGAGTARIWRFSPEGEPRWALEMPWDEASTIVPDARGGALLAGYDAITEIDETGAVLREVQVACRGWVALHRAGAQVSLVGMISGALSVDGTIRRVDPEAYSQAVVYATLMDP